MKKFLKVPRKSAYALIAAKTAAQPRVNIPYRYERGPDARVNHFVSDLDEILLEMECEGVITIGPTGTVDLMVHQAARSKTHEYTATADMLCGTQATGGDRADAALWLWLVIHGTELGDYGSKDAYGRDGSLAHLLICGLDLDRSSRVRDDTWTEWQGTFVDGDRVTGVTGEASCRCSEVEDYAISCEVDSITALLRQMLTGI